MNHIKTVKLTALSLLLLLLAGCGIEEKIADAMNPGGDSIKPVAVIHIVASEKGLIVGKKVMLDATRSYDPKDETLVYSWALGERPLKSRAQIYAPHSAITTFYADRKGYYTVTLIVANTSGLSSHVATKRIKVVTQEEMGKSVNPDASLKVAHSDSGLKTVDQITLDGNKSHNPKGETMTYKWTPANRLNDSNAKFQVASQLSLAT